MKDEKNAVIVIVDLGNNRLKWLATWPDGKQSFGIMPHDFIYLSPDAWERKVKRAEVQRARVQNSHSFQILNRETKEMAAVMIGEEALRSRGSNRRIGSNKYIPAYFDAVLCAVLQEVFPVREYPKGHEHIMLGIGHPPSEIENLNDMVNLVGGYHKIMDVYGNKRRFRVTTVTPWDEPAGGLQWFKSRPVGNGTVADFNPLSLNHGDQILTVDVGGSIGSIGTVYVNDSGNLVPMYDSYRAINQGIINVMDKLRDALKNLHAREFKGMDIPEFMLQEALRTGYLSLSGGEAFNVMEAVSQALTIVDDIQVIYETHFTRGRAYKGIILTGGGMRDLYEHIYHMLDHQNIHSADTLDNIVFANVNGGRIITLASLIEERKLPQSYQEVFYGS